MNFDAFSFEIIEFLKKYFIRKYDLLIKETNLEKKNVIFIQMFKWKFFVGIPVPLLTQAMRRFL